MDAKHDEIPLQEIVYKPTTVENINNASTALKPVNKPNSINLFLYVVAAIANLMGFSAGIAIVWVTPVLPKLDGSKDIENNPLGRAITPSEVSWIAGLLPLGAMFGPLVAGKIADKIGRKRILLCIAALNVTSLLITAFSKTVILFCISRFLQGIATGSIFAVLPMFLAEIAENHNRGALGCSMSIFVSSGLNFALIVGPYLTIKNFCLVCMCPSLIFIPCFFILSTETPLFLASVSDQTGLRASLYKLRNKNADDIEIEFAHILEAADQHSKDKGSIKALIESRCLRKALIISLGLIALQQLAGVGAIFSYMQTIFETAGGKLTPEISAMIIGSFQVLGTILASIVVDRLGRKVLLLGSSIGTCVTLALLGLYFYLKINQYSVESLSWLPVSSLVIFILAFGVGLGPVPWAVMAELFPSNARSVASALTSVTCFLTTFIVTVTFPFLSLSLGMAKCFWLFSLICMVGSLFIYQMLPETKGKSLQTIQKLLEGNQT